MQQLIQGRYAVRQRRGIGPCGAVYEALDQQTGERVAIKILNPASAQNDALRSALHMPPPRHAPPALVSTLDRGFFRQMPYRVTPYITGPNLAEWVQQQRRPLSPAEAMSLVAQVALALQKKPHGNLKPTNLLLEDGRRIRLTDSELPSPPGRYTAPEVAAGQPPSPAADVYSIGQILCDAWHAVPQPEAVKQVLARAIADEPRRRPHSLTDLAHALEKALGEHPPGAAKSRGSPILERLLYVAAAVMLAVVVFLVAFVLINSGSPPSPAVEVIQANSDTGINPTQPPPQISGATLPPTWTPSPTPPPRPTLVRTPTPVVDWAFFSGTLYPTLSPEQLVDTYWDGDGYDSMWQQEFPDGTYPRFTVFPVNLWVGKHRDESLTAEQEAAIQNAIQQIGQVVPIQRVNSRVMAHISLWLMTDEEFESSARCSFIEFTVGCTAANYTDAGLLLVSIWLRIDDSCFGETVLHELTHALGVGAHSPYPEDVMYFQQTCNAPVFTQRDLNTLWTLYNVAPPFNPRGN